MTLNSDLSSALQLLENIQVTINQSDDVKLQAQSSDDLNLLINLLENPIFRSVIQIQDSLSELNNEIQQHPSILPVDFDLTLSGELVITAPQPTYQTEFISSPNPEIDDQRVPVAKLSHSSSGEPNSPQISSPGPEEIPVAPITNSAYVREFQKILEENSQNRDVVVIQLFKPEGYSLGFSVVGLKSEEKGELGIFVQEIQAAGIAGRDGRLREGDQILAIDGQPLDSNISHQQAISILQKARGLVELVVARTEDNPPSSPTSSPTPSAISETSKAGSDMVLNTEWAQVEVIDLINDGSGLGFGIIGGRSTGVVVKTILPAGVADRDGRLQSGDHILQIGDVNLRGMGSEQVAAVLRQSGSHVRLVVARPVEPTSPDYQALGSHAPIVPTKILNDPEELDRHLVQNGYPQVTYTSSSASSYDNPFIFNRDSGDIDRDSRLVDIVPSINPPLPLPLLTMDMIPLDAALPEMERFSVELKKDSQGLGITIAGYVCEKEELSGIFVKSISDGSAADLCKKIQVNDRIVEVDGQSLQGFTNHDAVEVLRSTGASVQLTLERYLRGPKFEQLQQAIANSELKPSPSSPSAVSLPQFPLSTDGESTEIEVEGESITTMDSVVLNEVNTLECDTNDLDYLVDDDYSGILKPSVELAIKSKWSIMGPDVDIVVGQLCKFNEGGGLGISLEGTVDVEDGQEVRPHHYIRSILPDGPVGQNGKLRSGDELLEVNGHRLLGMNHIEVVTILKELPMAVRMVCARRKGENPPLRLIDTSQDRAAFAARNILGGSLQNLIPSMDRLVKAKSDGSLASNTTVGTEPNLSKLRSRSLEPITGLAMWSSEPHIIELTKGDRGLGFSILDYQDPMNPSETVIVIRSLVPGGVAQIDGRLIPGDRLLSVNSVSLDNASLDQAVQALKGAPKGTVRITVAKPLPIPDSVSHSQDTDEGLSQNTPTLDDHSMYSCSGSIHSGKDQELETDAILEPLPQDYPEQTEKEDVSFKSPDFQEDICFKSPDFQEDVSFKSPDFQEDVSFKSPEPEMSDSLEREFAVESPGENVSACALLDSLESEITIHIDKRDYGFCLESLEDGFNGAIVTALTGGGLCTPPSQSHLRVGDIVTWINDNCLRNSSPQEIKRIIQETQLPSTFIRLKYISKKTAVEYFKQIDHCEENIQLFKVFSKYWDLSVARGGSIERRTRSALCSPVGRDSPSDKESEYVDCDCLDERSSTLVAIVPEEPEPVPWIDAPPVTRLTEQPDSLPDLPPQQSIPPVDPVVPIALTQRTNPLESSISFDRTKVPDDSAHKSPLLDSLITSSLESLNNFNIKLGKELIKGVSEPILNKNCVDISEVFSFNRNLKGSEMTVTQGSSAAVILAKHWGPQRSVQVVRESEKSLGISIVGGKVDLYNTSRRTVSTVSGIFIKNVIQNSPAGKTGALKTGDRILQVDGIDLTTASHETAVYVIRSAGNPVNFLVQSLVYRDIDLQTGDIIMDKGNGAVNHKVVVNKCLSDSSQSSEDDEQDEEDLESKVRTSAGIEISRASAGNIKRSAEEKSQDAEEEDQFGYTTSKCIVGVEQCDTTPTPDNVTTFRELHEKALKKYGHLGSDIVLVELEKSATSGLGIALAGHKDRNRMAVLICGLYPEGQAHAAGTLKVGDEILEVNGIVVHNRCHLNASAIIKGLPGPKFKIIALRKQNLEDLSVRPITHFPFYLQDKGFEQRYDSFKGVKTVTIKKQSGQGLGIMIIEGKHAEVGQGIFISDIQDGSVAQQAGLNVGDMILAVNKDDLLGANYDTAADTLKKTEGVVTLTVCSPNRAQKEEKKSVNELPVSPAASKAPSNQATPKAPAGTPGGKSGGTQSPYSVKTKSDWDEAAAATAPITPSTECLVEINRDKLAFGMSVVGGSDTPLGCVCVHEIYPDGAVAKDGRLKSGDKILEINGEDCRDITNEKVINLIRSGQPKYKMVVFRREGSCDTAQGYDSIDVELSKKGTKGLGICLVGRKSGQGVFVNEVVAGGSAASESKMMVGDIILAVNDTDTFSMSADEVATHIKISLGKVSMKLGRYKTS